MTLPQPANGNSPIGAPHVRPALFIRISSVSVRFLTSSIKAPVPASVATSPANPSADPGASSAFNSAATASQASPLRLAISTRAPAHTNPSAAMRPMPVAPPVTNAVFPARENKLSGVIIGSKPSEMCDFARVIPIVAQPFGGNAGPFHIETHVECICHANAAMHLYAFLHGQLHRRSRPCFGQ